MNFQPKRKRPMTPAERQRRCRANGKGRHRGYRPTRAQRAALAAQLAQAPPAAVVPAVPDGIETALIENG